jgi:hypothetical protein
MLEGRSDNRVARLEAPLEVSLAVRLDVPVDFRYLDFRLDRFEITVSPPHPTALQQASKHLGADPALRPSAAVLGPNLQASWAKSRTFGYLVSDPTGLGRHRDSDRPLDLVDVRAI